MKIEAQTIIKIDGRTRDSGPLRALEKGSEVTARILERMGPRKAVLDIYGRRVNAEFLKGVPSAATVLLRLEDVTHTSFIFNLVEPAGTEEIIEQIARATIFDLRIFGKNFFHESGRLLPNRLFGIFELNAFYLSLIMKKEKKDLGIAKFLNKLLKQGLGKDALLELSILLSGANNGIVFVLPLLAKLGLDRMGLHEWPRRQAKDWRKSVDQIVAQLGKIDDKDEQLSVVQQLIWYLSDASVAASGWEFGEIAFFDDETFHPLRYMGSEKSWIFSVEFSSIGRIDILIKDLKSGCHVSIFCARDDIVTALQESGAELEKDLNEIKPPVFINYYNMPKALNKIVEIYSRYSVNSVFDVRA